MESDDKINQNQEKPRGHTIGQYYLMEKIAQGGMAEIYKGLSYDLHGLKKTVVIKKILPHIAASKEFIDSLIDEAKIAVTLSHGNIAQTYDLGKVGDDYFMVMEFVDGKSLSLIQKRCLAAGRLIPIPILCHFICEVLSGLDYMHRRTDEKDHSLHIVHRDISPQNLIVTYSGTVKIIDFGIAKAAFKIQTTDSGILKGKFSYMSPEQARGDAIDHRSDIFSIGVVFHEMLTGKRLFKADDNRETLRNVRQAKVEPPSSFRGDLPEELDRIVTRALARDRRHRYAFASDMRDDLLKFISNLYPDFKTSDAADFVSELFHDEISKSTSTEEEMKTPQMIIDRTCSALTDESQFEETAHAKAPLDMKEFFLEEEPVPETTAPEIPEKNRPELAVAEEVALGKAPRVKWPTLITKRTTVPLIFLGVSTIIFFTVLIFHSQKRIPAEMAPLTAQILVTALPSDARILIDGALAGEGSPITIRDIDADKEHIITAEREGYISQSQNIKLKGGEFRNFKITLTKAVSAKCTLIISSAPPGATIFLDDMETAYRTPATIPDIETQKRHTLGLFLDGYKYWSREFKAHAGEIQNFDVQLAHNFGALFIDSAPQGALVMLNDTPSGQTPLNLENIVPQKVYRVEVWLEGYEPYTGEVRIEAGKKKEIHITLKKTVQVPTAPVRAAPPEQEPSAPQKPESKPPPSAPKEGSTPELME